MRRFTDNKGNTWNVDVNVQTIKQVRELCEIDLLDINSQEGFAALVADTIKMINCIFVICMKQADQLEISSEEFGEAIAGDCVEEAVTALLEGLMDFFPKSRREILSGMMQKFKAADQRQLKLANQMLQSPEMDEKINQLMDEEFGKLFGSVPESSASTQGD